MNTTEARALLDGPAAALPPADVRRLLYEACDQIDAQQRRLVIKEAPRNELREKLVLAVLPCLVPGFVDAVAGGGGQPVVEGVALASVGLADCVLAAMSGE